MAMRGALPHIRTLTIPEAQLEDLRLSQGFCRHISTWKARFCTPQPTVEPIRQDIASPCLRTTCFTNNHEASHRDLLHMPCEEDHNMECLFLRGTGGNLPNKANLQTRSSNSRGAEPIADTSPLAHLSLPFVLVHAHSIAFFPYLR